MYGTVCRFQVKPGMESQFGAVTREFDSADIPGSVGEYVYQMDKNSNEFYLVVLFESAEAYKRNADSPEQNARYGKFRALLAAEPEWHDGEIVHARTTAPVR